MSLTKIIEFDIINKFLKLKNKNMKKLITIFSISCLLLSQSPSLVMAQEEVAEDAKEQETTSIEDATETASQQQRNL